MKNFPVALLLISVILVAGCTSTAPSGTITNAGSGNQAQCNDNGVCDSGETITQCPSDCNQAQPEAPASVNITMSDAGFSPNEVTIRQGGIVTWANAGSTAIWPASAFHPTHTVYPSSDINRCGTAEATGIFDACRGIQPGESWLFVFNEKGTWAYHDHLNPSRFGRVIVV